jgi:hypothetical protein
MLTIDSIEFILLLSGDIEFYEAYPVLHKLMVYVVELSQEENLLKAVRVYRYIIYFNRLLYMILTY